MSRYPAHRAAAACAYAPPPEGQGYPLRGTPPAADLLARAIRRGPYAAHVRVLPGPLLVAKHTPGALPLPEDPRLIPERYRPDPSLLAQPVPLPVRSPGRPESREIADAIAAAPDGDLLPYPPHVARYHARKAGAKVTVRKGKAYKGTPDIPKGQATPAERDTPPPGTVHFYLRPDAPRRKGEAFDLAGNRVRHRYLPLPAGCAPDEATLLYLLRYATLSTTDETTPAPTFGPPDIPHRHVSNTTNEAARLTNRSNR